MCWTPPTCRGGPACRRLHWLSSDDPKGALAAVGGFEIATMAGFYLGAPKSRMPVMVDRFITSSAALAALAMEPGAREALFFRALLGGDRAPAGAGAIDEPSESPPRA